MSSRQSRARQSRARQPSSTRISDDKVVELVAKLQALLPGARTRGNDRESASRVLHEICSYIQSLHREVGNLSERLSELLAAAESGGAQEELIRSLLMQ